LGQVIFVLIIVGGLGIFFYRHFGGAALATKPVQASAPKPVQGVKHGVEGASGSSACAGNGVEVLFQKCKPALDETAPVELGSNEPDTDAADLHADIVALVARTPGMLQVEIYANFPNENRKSLQAVLLRMDRSGALKRVREGSSYRLFVA